MLRLSFALAGAWAQLAPLDLWPSASPPPGENGFKCGPEALITTVGPYANSRRYYNVSRPTITPYLVTNGTGAAVVIGPGGGYGHLAWDDEGLRVAALFNAGGVSAFVLKYRVPLRPPAAGAQPVFGLAQLMDAQRAMGLVRARAGEWSINASRVGFIGFSAGGHLTAHLSTTWATRAYARIDNADDFPCRPDFSILMCASSAAPPHEGRASTRASHPHAPLSPSQTPGASSRATTVARRCSRPSSSSRARTRPQ
jgi:hypothetical protein